MPVNTRILSLRAWEEVLPSVKGKIPLASSLPRRQAGAGSRPENRVRDDVPASTRGSILLLVLVFMMVFSILGITAINTACQQEIQSITELNSYRANLLADAGLEWGKLWISSSCINQNVFPENVTGSSSLFEVTPPGGQTLGTHGHYVTGIYPLPGNNVDPANAAVSSSGTYVITTTATITLNIAGTMDTLQCKTIEVYIQRSTTCTPAGVMQVGRDQHTATLLTAGADAGKVLIVGGRDNTMNLTASAELYDPKTNSFSLTGPMATARKGHAATLLQDGSSVLVTGGNIVGVPDYSNTGELYNAGSFGR